MEKQIKIGQKVKANGYEGTIVRTRESAGSAWMGNMVEVRLQSGVVCVDASDVETTSPTLG